MQLFVIFVESNSFALMLLLCDNAYNVETVFRHCLLHKASNNLIYSLFMRIILGQPGAIARSVHIAYPLRKQRF